MSEQSDKLHPLVDFFLTGAGLIFAVALAAFYVAAPVLLLSYLLEAAGIFVMNKPLAKVISEPFNAYLRASTAWSNVFIFVVISAFAKVIKFDVSKIKGR